jgi:hypothetical protein
MLYNSNRFENHIVFDVMFRFGIPGVDSVMIQLVFLTKGMMGTFVLMHLARSGGALSVPYKGRGNIAVKFRCSKYPVPIYSK